MCGIAALLAYGAVAPPVDAAELLTIREAMRPRGPDGEGLWTSEDGRVGLAQRRLAIIDLSPGGLQPMWSSDRRHAIVFNGEIYNWRELRRDLEARGATFRTQSDTEVILALYAAEGAAGLDRLRGMYTVALWDTAERGLLLARDPLGIKPLYLADDGQTLRVASQVKALLAGGQVARDPDPAGHAGFFLWGHVPEPLTLFAGIRSLPPGGRLWHVVGGARRAWRTQPVAALLAAPPRDLPVAERVAEVRARVGESLRAHLVADVPVGLFLSAGRDSSCLASLLGVAAADTRAFTLGVEQFAGTVLDEVPLAAETARACGLPHDVRYVGHADLLTTRDALLQAMDQPTVDGVNVFFVARAAAAAGHRVALSGLGADELFGGYGSFSQIPRLVRWAPRWPRTGRALRRAGAPILAALTSPKWAGLLEYGGSYPGAYLLRRALYMPWELERLLGPDVARAGLTALATEATLGESLEGLVTPRQKVTALETTQYMTARLLRDADWAGMAHGLEIRTPFADAELYRQLAPLLAAKEPPMKNDLVQGDPRLPAAVALRRKTGFVVPVDRWLKAEGVPDRGLRGWAKLVYHAAAGASSLLRA